MTERERPDETETDGTKRNEAGADETDANGVKPNRHDADGEKREDATGGTERATGQDGAERGAGSGKPGNAFPGTAVAHGVQSGEGGGGGSGKPGAAPGGRKPWKSSQVWKGIGLVFLLHFLLMLLPVGYLFIGVTQLIYVVPALIWCRKDTGLVQGILIGAGITFLLNAACFGIVMVTFAG